MKTASSDNAPAISKSFVALPPPAVVSGNPDAVAQSQSSTLDDAGRRTVAQDAEVDAAAVPPPRPARRLPSPPTADSTSFGCSQSRRGTGWQVVSSTLHSPRQRPRRAAASSRLRELDVSSGSVQQRPSLKTSSSSDWLRLLEKLGDTQFGEVHKLTHIVLTAHRFVCQHLSGFESNKHTVLTSLPLTEGRLYDRSLLLSKIVKQSDIRFDVTVSSWRP